MIDLGRVAVLLLVLLGVWQLSKILQKEKAAFGLSRLSIPQKKSLKYRLFQSQKALFFLALFFFGLAFCNPAFNEKSMSLLQPLPRKGVAIYLLIDESGSMAESAPFDRGKMISKSDFAKELGREIIEKRKNDLIGLIGFARKADIICPLTLDKNVLISRLNAMHVVKNEDEEGTAIGYAIFKTVNLIVATKHFAKREREKEKKKPTYSIDNQIIIVLTDGLQSPNPLDRANPFRFMRIEEACDAATQNGIRVYYVGVDPVLENSEFRSEAEKMKRAVESTKGEFFISNNDEPIRKIFSQIDTLEKSDLYMPNAEVNENDKMHSLTPLCIVLGLLFLSLGVLVETVFARVAP